MKSILIAVALVVAAATLSPASANIDASLTPNATVNTPKAAKAPTWQMAAYVHITS